MNEQDTLRRLQILELKVKQLELQAELQKITTNERHPLDGMFVGRGWEAPLKVTCGEPVAWSDEIPYE